VNTTDRQEIAGKDGEGLALKLKEQATCVVLLFKFELLINISLGVTF